MIVLIVIINVCNQLWCGVCKFYSDSYYVTDTFCFELYNRREAYTCWPTNSGAEEFNFGTRIDHILGAGPCLHKEENQGHSLVTCHVKECDILEQFKRWKPGSIPRLVVGHC